MPPTLDHAFAPAGESAQDLWIERSNFNGVVLANVAYGTHMKGRRRSSGGLAFTQLECFAMATIALALQDKFNQMTFIDFRDFPGGPNAFTVIFYSTPVNAASFVIYTIMAWFADGLVLYRFFVIYDRKRYMLALPLLIWLGGIASGIALIISIVRSDDSFWAETSIKLGTAFWAISLGLNILLTSLIATRLLIARYHVRALMGVRYGNNYISIVSMLVESAALYSVWALAFLITFAQGSPVQNLLLPALGQVQGIAPLLILMRVLDGQAWSTTDPNGLREFTQKATRTPRNAVAKRHHSGEVTLPGLQTLGPTRSLIVFKDTEIETMYK
ncbi:hypothetical protein K435DRAFT_912160 [Dendrothele bispora CBS 962.96]|uniref:G-protein coupled receptors family 3 profile domain-containing protein n=1 Tax=Dendrothele bispora (strain CBS 962.96) TaxID=1314807 RepID=A0A4S8LM81_DENBC|nr:hypothetical protein K435DRAFT_912160 [Dendrothele bispora CBS 962.96]